MTDATAAIPYAELTSEQKLRAFWMDFCQADPAPETFADDMESAGLIFLDGVEADDLEAPFADELGIYPGGSIWRLTDEGRRILNFKDATL